MLTAQVRRLSRKVFVYVPGLLALILFAGCAKSEITPESFSEYIKSSQLGLTMKIDTDQYQPGQAVLATVTLTNLADKAREGYVPDTENTRFLVRKTEDSSKSAPVSVEPVRSLKEKNGERVNLEPGQTIERTFVFTTLSMERGSFALLAEYADDSAEKAPLRAFAEPAAFTVAGEKALLQRSLDGMITEQSAIKLARAHTGIAEGRAEGRLILDEQGFHQWWINLWPAASPNQPVSYFVNPYLGRVWKEAQPFDPQTATTAPFPDASKRIQELKEKQGR